MNSIGNVINQNRRQLLWKAVLGIGIAAAGSASLLPSQLLPRPQGKSTRARNCRGSGAPIS